MLIRVLILSIWLALSACASSQQRPTSTADSRVDVQLVDDEAVAALAILETELARRPVTEAQWNRLYSAEGYVRLRQRESYMKRDSPTLISKRSSNPTRLSAEPRRFAKLSREYNAWMCPTPQHRRSVTSREMRASWRISIRRLSRRQIVLSSASTPYPGFFSTSIHCSLKPSFRIR